MAITEQNTETLIIYGVSWELLLVWAFKIGLMETTKIGKSWMKYLKITFSLKLSHQFLKT